MSGLKKLSRTSIENDVKHNLRKLCDIHNAIYFPFNSGSIFGKAGTPDYYILTSNGFSFVVEAKRPFGATQSPAQKITQKKMEEKKGTYLLFNGLNEDELIILLSK